MAAKIDGKRACLKVGQTCKRSLDKQYHRYGFHCHTGRLARATKPKPSADFSRKVDVGGFRLAITCRGTGSPTVVLESGGGVAAAEAWIFLERTVAKTTRVCSYDRAGLGSSDPRNPPGPAPAAKVVEELHALLTGAGISPPYVLGGWSLGAFFSRLYAKRYPAEVVGLVSIDGTPIGVPGEPSWVRAVPDGFPPIDLIGGPGLPDSYYLAAADAELSAAPGLGSRPLVVLMRGRADGVPEDRMALWLLWQKRVALLSTSSILVRADAGHGIQRELPDLTAEAFRLVIAAVRARNPLPACSATKLPELSGTCLDPSLSPLSRRSVARAGTTRWVWTEPKASRIVARDANVRLQGDDRALEAQVRASARLYGGLALGAREMNEPAAASVFQSLAERFGKALAAVEGGVKISNAACKGTGAAEPGRRFQRFRCAATSRRVEVPSAGLVGLEEEGLPTVIEGQPRILGPWRAQLDVRVTGSSAMRYRQVGIATHVFPAS